MKFPLAFAGILAWLGVALLLTEAGSPAQAQVTGTVNPSADRTEPAAKDEPPPGGCMPIGVTASGEIVFPFLCKGFIEQHKAASQKPAASDDAGDRPAATGGQPKNTEEKNTEEKNAEHKNAEHKNAEEKNAEDKSAATQPASAAPRTAEPAAEAPETVPGAQGGPGSSPKPAVAEERRPTADGKPESTDENSAAKPPDSTATIAKSGPEPAGPAPSPEREHRKPREGSAGPRGCTHFRTYDRSSGTYTDYSGRLRACRS
jgi:hypothetical protein